MGNAHAGKILHIDLSSKKIWEEKLDKKLASNYLGARGINAHILWDKVKPGIDPLGPDNVLIFGAGALSGTHAPSSGRTSVTCKSPATNRYLKSSAGGHWGNRLKFAGYDNLVVYGASEKPVYVLVDDNKVEIRDAAHLWGLTVPEADKAIKKELGSSDFETALIGPAGENKVKIAGIMLSVSFAAARGGPGAVMGSKNLKAIAVRGTGVLNLADPDAFNEAALAARKALSEDSGAQGLHAYGTAGIIEGINASGGFASYNFKQGHIDGVEKITGQALVNTGILKARVGCNACGISCHRFSVLSSGKFAPLSVYGPEYENFSALGSGFGVTELEGVLKANKLCNDYGLDTISTGGVIQWAMESVERGVLTTEDVDGLDLTWGNIEAAIEMITKIAYREGFGDLLAEGTKIASERVGQDSYKWAVQARGLEQSRVETRNAKSYALAFAVNPRGPDHLMTECLAEFGLTDEARQLVKEITGDEKYANPYLVEKRGDIVRWHEDCYAVTDCLGFCAFSSTLAYGVNPKNMAQMFSAASGIELTEEEIMFAGRRIITLERAFNMREGFSREDDKLPYRMYEPIKSGPQKGQVNSHEEIQKLLDDYFTLHEWDIETGCPTRETLKKLGMEDVADQLEVV
jgi:aldehyde:ferredoxin oxidoreductase